MPKRSAGLLMYHRSKGELEVFLIHPGGPYFAKKDKGVWAIPKGEYEKDEDPLAAAKREFEGRDWLHRRRRLSRSRTNVDAVLCHTDLRHAIGLDVLPLPARKTTADDPSSYMYCIPLYSSETSRP